MTSSAVNAYYSPTRNQIVFPSGILREPFFHVDKYVCLVVVHVYFVDDRMLVYNCFNAIQFNAVQCRSITVQLER